MLIPKNRTSTSPGEILLKEFLSPKGMSNSELAEKIDVPTHQVYLIINGRCDITPEIAERLANVFGTTSNFWMALQEMWENS